MEEDKRQFFSQMEKKKNFLEAIRKAIYDDKLWEDKAARYVSWLEPESLDEVDFIGYCPPLPSPSTHLSAHTSRISAIALTHDHNIPTTK
jgi:hypothetical protein